jgi:signal transduction histidine kinase
VAVVTLLTLVIAFSFVWFLIQRTRRLEAQRREAEELATLGVLAANLAHEIRNPLNSINLNLELLEEDLHGSDEEVTGSVVKTRREVGRLARLVSDFLTYARPSPPSKDGLQVTDLLAEVRDFLREEARNMGVHLRLARDLHEAGVAADASQLRQVLLNLVLNGVQAVAGLEPERRVVELDSKPGSDPERPEVALCVRDRGDGIAHDDLPKVKSAFFTSRRGGTGLGLAIAERIVEAHGGRIDLVNLEPRGFEARVVLPITPEDGNMTGDRGAKGRNGRTLREQGGNS